MAQFYVGPRPTEVGAPLFLTAVEGRSITSVNITTNGELRIELSGGVLIECAWRGEFILRAAAREIEGLPQTITAVNLPLGEPIGELTAWEVNRKLKGFRTTYSIFYLLENGQTDELAQFLKRSPYGDIEKRLILRHDQLNIEAFGLGSFWTTVRSIATKHTRAIFTAVGFTFKRSRDAIFRSLEANARLQEAKADREEIGVLRDDFELRRDQTEYALDPLSKIKDPEGRVQVNRVLRTAALKMISGDIHERQLRREIRDSLPSPASEDGVEEDEQ